MTAKQKGNYTELRCLAACIENGYEVSIPYGENSHYDFIIDVEGSLIRIQAKTATLKKGTQDAIIFQCRSMHRNATGITHTSYSSENVDYFATFWKDKVYLVPVEECSTSKTLRLNSYTGSQNKLMNFAEDYELKKQLQKIKEKNKK